MIYRNGLVYPPRWLTKTCPKPGAYIVIYMESTNVIDKGMGVNLIPESKCGLLPSLFQKNVCMCVYVSELV